MREINHLTFEFIFDSMFHEIFTQKPQMSLYQESDADREFSKAGTPTGGVSLSKTAANQAELSRSLEGAQESINSNEDFSPTVK